jgi:hypothetical protein
MMIMADATYRDYVAQCKASGFTVGADFGFHYFVSMDCPPTSCSTHPSAPHPLPKAST